jgi:hypothetical protein
MVITFRLATLPLALFDEGDDELLVGSAIAGLGRNNDLRRLNIDVLLRCRKIIVVRRGPSRQPTSI